MRDSHPRPPVAEIDAFDLRLRVEPRLMGSLRDDD
jgi:hypothetical protein